MNISFIIFERTLAVLANAPFCNTSFFSPFYTKITIRTYYLWYLHRHHLLVFLINQQQGYLSTLSLFYKYKELYGLTIARYQLLSTLATTSSNFYQKKESLLNNDFLYYSFLGLKIFTSQIIPNAIHSRKLKTV